MPFDDTTHGQVFVDGLPTQRCAIEAQGHLGQLCRRRLTQAVESCRWKTDLAAIVQFDKTICPSAQARIPWYSRSTSEELMPFLHEKGFMLENRNFNSTQNGYPFTHAKPTCRE